MHYSEFPPEHYEVGKQFAGDVEKWNWRWALKGEDRDDVFDAALNQYFNRAQRSVMNLEPAEALTFFKTHLPDLVQPGVAERLMEAQDRLHQPLVASIQGNVVFANFRR